MTLNLNDPTRQLDLFIDTVQPKCAHTEHCCITHGCKYGDADCPVTSMVKNQSGPCWHCHEEAIDNMPPIYGDEW